MRHWFEDRFDTPDELPHDSGEGGIQWIWGGPFNPLQQIRQEFESIASDTAIGELSSALEDITPEWSGKPDDSNFDDEFFAELARSGDPYYVLITSLSQIESVAKRKRTKVDGPILYRLLFANVISAMETYLGDAFSAKLSRRDDLLERFVHNSSHFQAEKIPLSQVFVRFKTIDADVRNLVKSTIWHRLTEAEKLYKQAFGIKFPNDLKTIQEGIRDRHDIIHRNGKTKDGAEGTWGKQEIILLKEAVLTFAQQIEDQLMLLALPVGASSDEPIEI